MDRSHPRQLITGPIMHVTATPPHNEQLPPTNEEPDNTSSIFTDPVLKPSSRVRKPDPKYLLIGKQPFMMFNEHQLQSNLML